MINCKYYIELNFNSIKETKIFFRLVIKSLFLMISQERPDNVYPFSELATPMVTHSIIYKMIITRCKIETIRKIRIAGKLK